MSHANSVVATLRANCSGSALRATGGTDDAPEGVALVDGEGDGPDEDGGGCEGGFVVVDLCVGDAGVVVNDGVDVGLAHQRVVPLALRLISQPFLTAKRATTSRCRGVRAALGCTPTPWSSCAVGQPGRAARARPRPRRNHTAQPAPRVRRPAASRWRHPAPSPDSWPKHSQPQPWRRQPGSPVAGHAAGAQGTPNHTSPRRTDLPP